MKTRLVLLVLCLIGITNVFGQNHLTDRKVIRYVETARQGSPIFANKKHPAIPLKNSTISNNDKIVLSYDEALPNAAKNALILAKDIWEAKLPIRQPIHITILFEPMEKDIVMESEVVHGNSLGYEGCPISLEEQLKDLSMSDVDNPAGVIIFNSDHKWNYSQTDNTIIGYDLTTYAMRGIARCLGFGSSVYEITDNDYEFWFEMPSYFDKLLYNEKYNLGELARHGAEMNEFVKCDNVYVKGQTSEYKIFAPKEYVPSMSLLYFEDNNTLMSHSIGEGNVYLDIDDKTIDVLKAIGWDVNEFTIKIIGSDVDNDGKASSYIPHTFTLTGAGNVSSYSWKLYIKDKSQNYLLYTKGNSQSFTLNSFTDISNYYINDNGNLEARIECEYTLDGKFYTAVPLALYLELKPIILSVDNFERQENSAEYYYSVSFDVKYLGCNEISMEVEEEGNSSVQVYYYNNPNISRVNTGKIYNMSRCAATIFARNNYGVSQKTYEFEPSKIPTKIEPLIIADDVVRVQLYTLDGMEIYNGDPNGLSTESISKGIYLKKEFISNGIVKSSKVMVK